MTIYWAYLIASGLLAVGMTTAARFVEGHGAFWPTVIFFNLLLLSWLLLERATIAIPWGTAFAVWAGIGAVGTVILELVCFGGAAGFWQMFFLGVMALGFVGYVVTSMV